ncbi:phosphatase PAP2 family protein [Yinghuangia sp. ASG 101]|uniref:phosphatase PAP2 family protein n=1 Tax=Yinghuangia sp. ASG 101 TaxID=2896848 RepID=UPI001E62201A|nr:phosphatase PAP2 family protein [Yinghuangia sp. ASG 101]UGQ12836.1 phosphatase PAP2 family protein [Yinghuangia sp. ASG 101]
MSTRGTGPARVPGAVPGTGSAVAAAVAIGVSAAAARAIMGRTALGSGARREAAGRVGTAVGGIGGIGGGVRGGFENGTGGGIGMAKAAGGGNGLSGVGGWSGAAAVTAWRRAAADSVGSRVTGLAAGVAGALGVASAAGAAPRHLAGAARPGTLGRVHRADQAAFAWVASHHVPWANRALPALSRSANRSRLWMVAGASMALSGGRSGRRAALRGLGSVALASTVTNVVVKSWTRRPRPVLDLVPHVRRLPRQPWTSSFPSGHAASAAAFATGVALESRSLGAAAAVLATGVAFSRVYTGVHYPGDVLAGAALGAGAAVLTLRWWPRRPVVAAFAPQPRVRVPALPGGEGLIVVVNASAGPDGEVAPRLRELLPLATVIERNAPETDPDARLSPGPPPSPDADPVGSDLVEMLRAAASEAVVLGVAGGDGSINAAAKVALDFGCPLAVFPAGTLNHFAADLGLQRYEDTARAVRAGEAVLVDVAEIARDRTYDFGPLSGTEPEVFLNTFSVGVYPDLVRARESLERRIGKWPAMLVGLVEVLKEARPVKLRVNGRARSVWLLFLGNGVYAPPGFAPTYRPNLHDGLLDVRLVDAARPAARIRLVAAVLSGTLARSRVYEASTARAMRLTEIQEGAPLAVDGEVRPGASQLRIAKGRRLVVYRPLGARRA